MTTPPQRNMDCTTFSSGLSHEALDAVSATWYQGNFAPATMYQTPRMIPVRRYDVNILKPVFFIVSASFRSGLRPAFSFI